MHTAGDFKGILFSSITFSSTTLQVTILFSKSFFVFSTCDSGTNLLFLFEKVNLRFFVGSYFKQVLFLFLLFNFSIPAGLLLLSKLSVPTDEQFSGSWDPEFQFVVLLVFSLLTDLVRVEVSPTANGG